jgi:hypothetical protein
MLAYFRMDFHKAKSIVSPDKPVIPGSKEHKDILELMKQSGRIFPEQNIAVPIQPLGRVTRFKDLAPYRAREMPEPKPKSVSKRDWLSIDANRKAYDDHIAENQTVPIGYYEPEPRHISLSNKTATNWKGQSKREFIDSLK